MLRISGYGVSPLYRATDTHKVISFLSFFFSSFPSAPPPPLLLFTILYPKKDMEVARYLAPEQLLGKADHEKAADVYGTHTS